MDVATISALAATAAAIGAFSVAGVQLYVGHRQSEAALKAADAALMNAQSAGVRLEKPNVSQVSQISRENGIKQRSLS